MLDSPWPQLRPWGRLRWSCPAVAGADPAPNSPAFAQGGDRALFVQTDNTAGNHVVAYHRNSNGTLAPAGTYATGGVGGVLNGSAVDHLASQGSLTYDQVHNLLYAVNAGSNTVSVFSVRGDQLSLRQVVGSGGQFPVSVAVHGFNVYVLNAVSASVQGYVSFFGHLFPLPESDRSLGLTVPSDANQFTHTPGQVAVSPDGTNLVVTTKLNNDDIDVFHIGPFGTLSPSPVVTSDPGGPFGVTFDAAGHLVVANTASNSLATYALEGNGTATSIDTVFDGQAATCWVARAQGSFFASNGVAPMSAASKSSPPPERSRWLVRRRPTPVRSTRRRLSTSNSSTSRRAPTASWTSSRWVPVAR